MAKKLLKRKHIVILITIILVLAVIRLALPWLGEALVAKDEPESADLIVVLMGGGLNRVFAAVDLYKEGYSHRIVMVSSYQSGYDEASEWGITVPRETDIDKSAAIQLGVAAEDIIILPADASSTLDEAKAIREYLRNHTNVDTLIIATSPSHSARAQATMKWALDSLNREVKIISCPSPYDTFNPERWWQDSADVEQVVLEYIKYINFIFSR